MATLTVPAAQVQAEDFLPGLDNGYVFEDPDTDPDVRSGRWNTRMGGDEFVLITFHTGDGDEAYLLVPADMPVTVNRGAS